MGRQANRTLGGAPGPKFRPANWFVACDTPNGPARFWRLIPAEVFVQVRLFAKVGLAIAELGDVPIANEDQRRELSRFLGRSLVHVDRTVHVYQAHKGARFLADNWPDDELLRLVREAAIFNDLRGA